MRCRALPMISLLLFGCGEPAHSQAPSPSPSPEIPALPAPKEAGGAAPRRPESPGLAVGFVLTRSVQVDGAALVAAANGMGVALSPIASKTAGEPLGFALAQGGSLLVMPIPQPVPDASQMPRGPLSLDPAALDSARAHLIVTAIGLPEAPEAGDALFSRLMAATVRASDAVGAIGRKGLIVYEAEVYASQVESTGSGTLPIAVCIDMIVEAEPEERVSFMSHGLERYGREEFMVVANRTGKGALELLSMMIDWSMRDPTLDLPTGDTVGRTAEEKLLVQRVPNPRGEGAPVIRLDMP